ncbi:hypothetical protein Mth01_09640 [Sphaerimonospora thailandensis]|uniref:Uncharacterized protein n=1 Tax=Sphaerimonospora thailandensis TaxID=795644 RepID=A0A8J3R3T5_9ACTN|nr:hypothetical protein Mth01_09640 [Sphaerimonospora thailandensis]
MNTGTITSRPTVSALAMFQVLTRRVDADDAVDTDGAGGAGCGTGGGSLRSVMGLP